MLRGATWTRTRTAGLDLPGGTTSRGRAATPITVVSIAWLPPPRGCCCVSQTSDVSLISRKMRRLSALRFSHHQNPLALGSDATPAPSDIYLTAGSPADSPCFPRDSNPQSSPCKGAALPIWPEKQGARRTGWALRACRQGLGATQVSPIQPVHGSSSVDAEPSPTAAGLSPVRCQPDRHRPTCSQRRPMPEMRTLSFAVRVASLSRRPRDPLDATIRHLPSGQAVQCRDFRFGLRTRPPSAGITLCSGA